MDSTKMAEKLKILMKSYIHQSFQYQENDPDEEDSTKKEDVTRPPSSTMKVFAATTDILKSLAVSIEKTLSKLNKDLVGVPAQRNIQYISGRILLDLKTTAEQIQTYIEDCNGCLLSLPCIPETHELLLRQLTEQSKIDISAEKVEFRAEWKAYNLLLLGFLAFQLGEYQMTREANRYITFWSKHAVSGADTTERKVNGFAKHNLAVIHRIWSQHETASQYYDEAIIAYQKSIDWENGLTKDVLVGQVTEEAKKVKRNTNIIVATIGPQGGRLCVQRCEVQIPKGALTGSREFQVSTSIDESFDEEYIPITPSLDCEPATKFKSKVKFYMTTWCETEADRVPIDIFCKQNGSLHTELVATSQLQKDGADITFECKHFSSFIVMIKRKFFKKIKFKMTMNIWKSLTGNFIFISSIKDKTVAGKWKREMEERGYRATQAVFNPTVVRGNDELEVAIKSDCGYFSPGAEKRFKTDFSINCVHHEMFAYQQNQQADLATLSCEVKLIPKANVSREVKHKVIAMSVWHEQMDAVDRNAQRTQSDQSVTTAGERLEDVFHDEIMNEFQSVSMWRRFATSSHGLGLAVREVNIIEANFNRDFEQQRMKMLELWSEKTGGSAQTLLTIIRQTVGNFRQHLQCQ